MSGSDVFGGYAGFYDTLYADKDYAAEVEFLSQVFERFGVSAPADVLDLGCGTGTHDLMLAQRGHSVVGIDRAPEMIALAEQKTRGDGVDVEFHVGDVRTVDVGRSFDTVISMFAVVSYQCSNDDLSAMLATARRHLVPGGIFVFDAWFGPAVLSQHPEERTRTLETPDGDLVTRTARPVLDVIGQTVEVFYDVTRSRDGAVIEQVRESHKMRFLFAREIAYFLECAGFEMEALGPFMELDREPTVDDWNISVVARAV